MVVGFSIQLICPFLPYLHVAAFKEFLFAAVRLGFKGIILPSHSFPGLCQLLNPAASDRKEKVGRDKGIDKRKGRV